jgi:heme/copper-type cytochrome/quinol oxidase subunit 3
MERTVSAAGSAHPLNQTSRGRAAGLSRNGKGIDSAILGMVLVLMAETMLFAGLIGACVLLRARSTGAWPPDDLPRLPTLVTLANTLALLASVPLLTLGTQRRRRGLILAAAALGALFLAIQGAEWARMLTWQGGSDAAYGGIFYALIGVHALHVLGGAAALLWAGLTLSRSSPTRLKVCGMYWFFVVAVWPVLYGVIYH